MVGSGMARFGLAVVVGNVGVWWRGVRYGMAVEAQRGESRYGLLRRGRVWHG